MTPEIGSEVRTTCPYCGVGCGLLARVEEGGAVVVRGDPQHPANFGRLCSKGAALGETVDLAGRLLHPEVEGRRVTWDAALGRVAEGLRAVIAAHGPDAVAFYVSGQLLTEDYYVANKLMKGFIGAANIDSNSRLCMSSSVAAHRRAFGSDSVPASYSDLELADLVVLAGSNMAWCHPVLFQRLSQARARRPDLKVVVIDPRRTATCDIADLHLAVAPGSDAILFNGLLDHLSRAGVVDFAFLEHHAAGYGQALAAARAHAPSIPAVARACRLSEEAVASFFNLYTRTAKVVTVYSQGISQSSSGTDKVNALINCHLLTGRIGRPGAGPLSLTGQPNAMGGREVGALANQLAAHMAFDEEDIDRVGRFWNAPHVARRPGLKAVDLFKAIERGHIKALWIMATNPAVSLPDVDRVRAALGRCELVVVSDCVRDTDTTRLAHVRLPALAWGEKDGTVTNSERRISRQRAFLPGPGEARPDWWIVCQVARRMGHEAGFAFSGSAQIFAEHAALTAFENAGRRVLDLSALGAVDRAAYDAMDPVQWPLTPHAPGGRERLFEDGRFATGDGRASLVPVTPRPPVHLPQPPYPLVLNTGRVRDHWHTMTRTGRSPRLSAHVGEPYAEIHPDDARAQGVEDGGLVHLATRWGTMVARARIRAEQRRGVVFVPMHWSDCSASRGRVNALVSPAVDPLSGQPEFKHTPLAVTPYRPAWYGFALTRRGLAAGLPSYWVRAAGIGHERWELAGELLPGDWSGWAKSLLGQEESAQWLELQDAGQGRYRAALITEGRLEGCVFVAPTWELPSRAWLGELFVHERLSDSDRIHLLAARPPRGTTVRGPNVCACFGVDLMTLTRAIRHGGLASVEAIGARLQAGTNCGSCIPEIRALLAREADAA